MTAQDARERAFQLVAREYVADESFFNAGWDAAKREDEQRIAALVAAVRLIIADVVADPYTTPDISALQSAIARWSELDTNDK